MGQVVSDDCACVAKKLLCFQCALSWHEIALWHAQIVPIVSSQDVTTELTECIDSVGQFMLHNPMKEEKNSKHYLSSTVDFSTENC